MEDQITIRRVPWGSKASRLAEHREVEVEPAAERQKARLAQIAPERDAGLEASLEVIDRACGADFVSALRARPFELAKPTTVLVETEVARFDRLLQRTEAHRHA